MHLSLSPQQMAAATDHEALAVLVKDTIADAVGGNLDAQAMTQLSAQQLTLWAYFILRDEVMDGGFVQLIHNGYGPFFFRNPFAKAMRLWGLTELSKIINKGHKLFNEYGEEITRECSDEEFMALFENYPKFDDLDDEFVEMEEEFSTTVSDYVAEHLDSFLQ